MSLWRTSKFKYLPVWEFNFYFFFFFFLPGTEMSELSFETKLWVQHHPSTQKFQTCGIFPTNSSPANGNFGWRSADFWSSLTQSCPEDELDALVGTSPLSTSPSWLCSASGAEFLLPAARQEKLWGFLWFSVVFQLLPSAGLNLPGPRAANSSPLNHTHELSSCKTSQLWNFSRKFWRILHHFFVTFNWARAFKLSFHCWTIPGNSVFCI